MEKNKPFKFPEHIFKQLSECSNSWLLFVIDEDGRTVPYMDLANEATAKALFGFAGEFSEAVRNASVDTIYNGIRHSQDEGFEE